MSGGFIRPPATAAQDSAQREVDQKPAIFPDPLLKLTPRQEGRLRDHVDARLADLERDSKTHGFGTLSALLARLRPILRLILQIPPVEPWASLRTSYLLTLSGSAPSYIASLPLVSSRHLLSSQTTEDAGQVMRDTINFLNEVDKAWRVVLKGNAWVVNDEGLSRAVRVDYAGSVGQTERIRLRSIVITGRAKILAWARTYGTFPGSALGVNGAHTPLNNVAELGDWETEIMGMWNGILDMLSGGTADDEDDEMLDEADLDEVVV